MTLHYWTWNAINECDVIAACEAPEFLRADVRERLVQAGALDFCGLVH